MKTIKELIREGLTEVAATRDINRQESVKRVYKECPDLKDIDDQILEVRNSRFIAVIDNDERLIKRFDVAEEELMVKRDKIIARNNIDPDFDSEKNYFHTIKSKYNITQDLITIIQTEKVNNTNNKTPFSLNLK